MGASSPTERDRAIHRRVGHYMADVAKLLLRDGYPVVSISSCPPEELGDSEGDGGGYVDLGLEVVAQMNGAPKDVLDIHFDWSTSSGWSLVMEVRGGTPIERWMGAGLTPAPEKVAGFLLSSLLDVRKAGSEDQPYYRKPGHDLDALAERLAPFDRAGSFNNRFRNARNATAERWGIDAMLGEDTVLSILARTGELAALQHLVQFVAMSGDLREVAVRLRADLKVRVVTTTDRNQGTAVTRHSTGAEHAKQQRHTDRG
ncbi:hypothetical protein [Streptomyces sp. NPDC046870]|uniref:hypothetical protein n=1 Tax=Streptomyces sp. NPDC046870 TaxID=3155135 RepID=UPI003451FDB0